MVGPVIFNPAGQVREVRLAEALVLAGHRYNIPLPGNFYPRGRHRRNIVRPETDFGE